MKKQQKKALTEFLQLMEEIRKFNYMNENVFENTIFSSVSAIYDLSKMIAIAMSEEIEKSEPNVF